MLDNRVFIIVFSALVTIFVFIFLFMASMKPAGFKTFILRAQDGLAKAISRNRGKQNISENQTGWVNDLKIIFQQQGSIKVLGINVVSLESLLLIRIIMSVSFAILFIFLGFIFNRNLLIFGTVVSVIFYFLPLEILKGKLSLKSKKVLRELPDFIDILASLIKAGLTYNDSIIYITKNIGSEISSLFSIYHRKILEGYTKAEAFGIIGKMSFCSEFKSLVKVLHQSEIIGNPIKDVLKDLSRVYRNNQRDFLKIRAERLESNLIIVIFIFIFIPMLALFLIPIIPQLKLLLG